jgi:Zn-dependent peptidase ImmA (M78 family)/transcriptional regulator with XRE-family HTH domain
MPQNQSQALTNTPMPDVPVNGRVLKWARDLRALTLDNAAILLGITPAELHEYEEGDKKPNVGFLRTMADKYEINFASLLMPEPLPPVKRLMDHRVRHDRAPLTIDSIIAMDDVEEALEAFAGIADESPRLIPKLNIGTAALDESPADVAARERKKFPVSIETQRSWPNAATARTRWRQHIEDRGVFTYFIQMQPPGELSGFSLLHEGLGAICVNDREPNEGAKIFTMFHEYCHLLLRQGGISDENNNDRVERFCNKFAASFLIPRSSLVGAIGDVEIPYDFSDTDVKDLARQFRVSNRAMAYRLEETALAPDGFYRNRTRPWDAPAIPPKRPNLSPEQIGLIRLMMTAKRLGKLHSLTVLRANKRHLLNSFDASQLVGLQPASFPKLERVLVR